MSKDLIIIPPSNFNFENTVQRLRRGNLDPINKWDPQTKQWQRIISDNQNYSILFVNFCPKQNHIIIKKINGTLEKKLIYNKIVGLLGLDDPFINLPPAKYADDSILKPHWSTAVPGYSHCFEAFLQIITGQLVSTQVANLFLQRIIMSFGTPIKINSEVFYDFPNIEVFTSPYIVDNLRLMGISKTKSEAIHQVALRLNDKNWIQFILNPTTSIEQKHAQLIEIKGIGEWSADWFLFRGLRHFNIVPVSDLAVRKALSWWWHASNILSASEITKNLMHLGEDDLRGLLVYKIMCAFLSQNRTGVLL